MSKFVQRSQTGFALVIVLLVMAMLFVLVATLLFQSRTSRLVASNEQDYLAALGNAESGLTWAQRRIIDATNMTDLLLGPDNASAVDDNLLGLRDLSLTATGQFTNSNEATASAIVQRDFDGAGLESWEVVRINDGSETRSLLYVRIDDNYDDDPDDPANDDPLSDVDNTVRVTVVAEYPVFVDASGVEQVALADRGRARRTLLATFEGPGSFAITSNDDIDFNGGEICGDCGSMHANGDMTFSSGTSVCQNATATGSLTGSTGGIAGDVGGGRPVVELPVINPFDDRFVPAIGLFDSSTDAGLPPGLQCPEASATDPGANKYFALVSNGDKGEVWKAYWDSGNDRWTWSMIDDLGDSIEVALDDCGRAPGDANYGSGSSGPVDDGKLDEFYGIKGAKVSLKSCASCSSAGRDASLCGLTDNDFNATGYYPAGGGGLVASPPLPGNFQSDGAADFDPTVRWDCFWSNTSGTAFSPLYGAVLWVLGAVSLGGNVGASNDFECSALAGCTSTVLPYGTLPISLIAIGTISLSGSANVSPANPGAGYPYLFVSGRDVVITGNAQADTQACGGSCSGGMPSDIARIAGVYAAHEAIEVGGGPNLFGFLVGEEAIDCANDVNGSTKISGNAEIAYDCNHPPNPWAEPPVLVSWQEVD